MMANIKDIVIFVSFVICIQSVSCAKLNVPRVLLPVFHNVLPNYTLEVTEGGCYKWSVSRLDLVMLTPLDVDQSRGCSSRTLVTGISREKARNTAIVLAEDVITKQILRCDVILDVIKSLGIVTTTRELFVEEAPETFEVEAYDAQGNTFTTLEGVEFSWTVTSSNVFPSQDTSDVYGQDSVIPHSSNVVMITSFLNSIYETPHSVLCFDGQGKFGHMVLLEGVNTGTAKVVVRLPHHEYSHVESLEVSLVVVANLILSPTDVYLLPGDTIPFKLVQIRKGRIHPVDLLQDSQYYLEVEEMGIAAVNGHQVTGMKNGDCRIFVRDRNAAKLDNNIGISIPKLPQAYLVVAHPQGLKLALLPHNNWVTLVGNTYTIAAEMFTSNEHKMFMGAGVQVEISFVRDMFGIVESNSNGTELTGIPEKNGTMKVSAKFLGVVQADGSRINYPKLTATADMLIFNRISLVPSEITLPWDPILKPKYEVQLKASGGDGGFTWSSGDTNIAGVSQTGRMVTSSFGQTTIKAAMSRNLNNFEIANVNIIPPTELQITDYVLEVPLGSSIVLHVALFGVKSNDSSSSPTKFPFSQCHTLPLQVKIQDNIFTKNATLQTNSVVGIACTNVILNANEVGTSKITISYPMEHKTLQDSVTVSCFRPLIVTNPKNRVVVLAVGSSRNIIFTGGPKPWPNKPSEHKYGITSDTKNRLTIDEVPDISNGGKSGIYAYNVLCKEVGESVVKFTVGNIPTLPNCRHDLSSVTVTVICALPRSIHLVPSISVPEAAFCPMDLTAETVIQQNHKDVKLLLEVHDQNGRKFDNITSLKLDWSVTPCNLSICTKLGDFESEIKHDHGVEVPGKYFQIIPTAGKSGLLKIVSTVKTYKKWLRDLHITPEYPEFGIVNERGELYTPVIKDNINLYLVQDTLVQHNNLTIFNHPSNIANVIINQGSGFYELHLTSDDVAKVSYNDKSRTLQIEPVSNGYLRVDLVDLCLPSEAASVYVNVVSIKDILVKMPDRVEKGQCVRVIVKLLDENNQLMPVPEDSLLDLRYVIENELVSLKLAPREDNEPWGLGEVHYILTGLDIGDSKLQFFAGRDRREIQSTVMSVQVFAPLRLSPRNVTLIVGSTLQINVKGGPHLDIAVDFVTDKDKIASVSSGVITGHSIGYTRITGRAVGINPSTGTMVTYSKDTIDVFVIPLEGISIHSPLVQVEAGAILPMWITGVPDQLSPMILGSRDPPFDIRWQISGQDTKVVSILSVFHNVGVEYEVSDQIAIRVLAAKTGRVQITAYVVIPTGVGSWRTSQTLASSVDLEVFGPLELTVPSIPTSHILIAPNSKLNLITNKDSSASLNYNIQTWSHDHLPSAPILTINKHGTIESGSIPGNAMVLISTKEDNGIHQTIGVFVEVRPVHYMMVDLLHPIKMIKPLNKLPRGLSLRVTVTYHDSRGRRFMANNAEVSIASSRSDLISVGGGSSNSSIKFDLELSGNTMIKVFEEGSSRLLVDFLKLAVSNFNDPAALQNTFTVGDIICFNLHVSTENGFWSSVDHTYISIDAKTGVARALAETTTPVLIALTLNEAIIYKAEITILPIRNIEILPLHGRSFTGESSKPFKVYLVLGQEDSIPENNLICQSGALPSNLLGHIIMPDLFNCHISIEDAQYSNSINGLSAKPTFNPEKGLYSCDISSDRVITESQANSILLLTVSSEYYTSPTVKIRMLPPIVVAPKELVLKSDGSGVVAVSGNGNVLDNVKVVSSNTNVVIIGDPDKSLPGQNRYPIRLINYYDNRDGGPPSLVVTSETTDQVIKVHVSTPSDSCYADSVGESFVFYRSLFIYIATLIAVVIATIYVYANCFTKKDTTVPRTLMGRPVCSPCCEINKSNLSNQSTSSRSPYIQAYSTPESQHRLYTGSYADNLARLGTSTSGLNTSSADEMSPVYGDPSYLSTPETRRHRRFI